MDTDYLESMINNLDRKVRGMEDRLAQSEREARSNRDEIHRLEDRLRYVESFR